MTVIRVICTNCSVETEYPPEAMKIILSPYAGYTATWKCSSCRIISTKKVSTSVALLCIGSGVTQIIVTPANEHVESCWDLSAPFNVEDIIIDVFGSDEAWNKELSAFLKKMGD